ncbi:MAG: hypothetical protein BGP06_15260 [Rhizobiales bacterium 65-9]|nr:MAG: hypothetical protein BGP06_15260 [Rhizobiales bacterium 65-9]
MAFLRLRGRRSAGALRHRMTLEAPVDADDGAGGLTRGYAAIDHIWASIETISADAAFADNRPGARLTRRIQIRWRADLDTGKRLRLGARIFHIRSVADADERRSRLSLTVEEETP